MLLGSKKILHSGSMFLQARPINHGVKMCGIDRQGAAGLLEGLGQGQVLSLDLGCTFAHFSNWHYSTHR